MISHKIIVVKPPPVAPFVPMGFAPSRHVPVSQEELNKQVDHFGFNEGDFVTMAVGQCSSLYNVHCITHIQREIAGCHYVHGKPAAYLLSQVESAASMSWTRYDTPNDYRLLTQVEYDNLIGHNSDNLRHRCYEQSKLLIPAKRNQGGSPV